MNKFLLGAAIGLGAAYLYKTMNLGAAAYSYPGYDTSWIQQAQGYRPTQMPPPPVFTQGQSHASICEAMTDRQIAHVNTLPMPAPVKAKLLAQLQTKRDRCTPAAWTPHGTRVSGA